MSQHDYEFANQPGAPILADMNAILAAIGSSNGGVEQPATRVGGMFWLDTNPTTPGLNIRRQQNNDWLPVPMGGEFVPLDNGDITGDLHVAGIFSNPEYDALRGTHAGTGAPADPRPGMLWYDTSFAPPVIKLRQTDNTWTIPLPTANPTYQDVVSIVSATARAELNLIAAGERRRVVNDASGNRIAFYGPTDALLAYVTDAGDLVTGASGSVLAALATKENDLGYTPVRQAAATPVIVLTYNAGDGKLYASQGGVNLGAIYTTLNAPANVPLHTRNMIGHISFVYLSGTYADDTWDTQLVSGAILEFGWDGAHGTTNPEGTWRNLSGNGPPNRNFLAQRVA
jgi:hypothetical protein